MTTVLILCCAVCVARQSGIPVAFRSRRSRRDPAIARRRFLAAHGAPGVSLSTIDNFVLLAVPLFLLMSNVLLKGGVGRDLFNAVNAWVGHFPGGLAVATILSCAIFAAISGSSVATAATIGTVAIPEMIKHGYPRNMVLGLLAAGGTLGILIPPSIPDDRVRLHYRGIGDQAVPCRHRPGRAAGGPVRRLSPCSTPCFPAVTAAAKKPPGSTAGSPWCGRRRHWRSR